MGALTIGGVGGSFCINSCKQQIILRFGNAFPGRTLTLRLCRKHPLPIFNGGIMAIAGLIFGFFSVVAYFGLPGVITSAIGLFLT